MSLSVLLVAVSATALCGTFNLALAQFVPPPPDSRLVSPDTAKGETPDQFYDVLHAAERKDTPRVIIIPGILGSKVEQCEADGSQCSVIWGNVDALHRTVDLSVRSDKSYRTDVVDTFFFEDIYGSILGHTRSKIAGIVDESPNDPMLTVFHYDWRLSNNENASRLAERICAIRKAAPDSPINILAHSMGGLIAKLWAAHFAKFRVRMAQHQMFTKLRLSPPLTLERPRQSKLSR
jgi:pimeloyl-ACP methyl ester carboxylesterase